MRACGIRFRKLRSQNSAPAGGTRRRVQRIENLDQSFLIVDSLREVANTFECRRYGEGERIADRFAKSFVIEKEERPVAAIVDLGDGRVRLP